MSNEFEKRIGPARRDPEPAKAGLAKLLYEGSQLYRRLYGSVDPVTTPAQPQGADIKPAFSLQPVVLEIPTVSEEVYNKTREALKSEGFTYVVSIEPTSIGQLATDEATTNRFGFVNSSENMRAIVPPQMEVAIDPKNVKIENSSFQSTDTQIRMTQDEEAKLKSKLSQDIRGLVSMPMHDPSTLSQADFDYQDKTGKPLYLDFFVRTDTETVPGSVACVGRYVPSSRLVVFDWARGDGDGYVFAARVVVLPRKLTEPAK